MNQQKIGKFIAELRKEKGLTQEELANELGITKNAVSKWERGISLMDMTQLNPLCKILDISITELLNGERIEQESLKEKSDDTIKNTIIYSNKKIKKSRIKNIIFTVLAIFVLSVIIFFGYKLFLLNKYTYEKPDNIEKLLKGLNNQKEIKIYKRTIPEDEYLVVDNFKIKNDFDGFVKDDSFEDKATHMYRRVVDDKTYTIQFETNGNNYQLIDFYTFDLLLGDVGDNSFEKKFNSADRKFFLLKNDINNDVDFYKYVADNYYKENNIFMDKRTMMENFSFNAFVAIAVPEIDRITYIKGDYEGFIMYIGEKDDKTAIQVTLIKEGKLYGFLTNDPRFIDESYLVDIIGTVEIK